MVLPAFGPPHVDRSSLHEIPALIEQVVRRVAVAALLSIRRPDLDHQLWAPGSSGASLSFGCNIFSPYWRERKGALSASPPALPSPFGLHGSRTIANVS